MAVKKMPYLPAGTKVRTTKRVQWHGLDIPKGTVGEVVLMLEGGEAVRVKFDDGRRYGSFDVWANEIQVVKEQRPRPRPTPRPEDSPPSLDAFTRQYIETALWSSTDEQGRPLDDTHGIEALAPLTLLQMRRDADDFQRAHWDDISGDPGRAGHDFWLTRNGAGAGFWDGDWPEPAATRLTEASKAYGEFTLYVGDDGRIHGG